MSRPISSDPVTQRLQLTQILLKVLLKEFELEPRVRAHLEVEIDNIENVLTKKSKIAPPIVITEEEIKRMVHRQMREENRP